MRNLALSVAALLVLAVASPAFAQPFADVPTDHWAFDAIAELAAKGIIEGFPDGTFKGDRGVTRYEVAMIVARILARIEAIKIPAAAAPAAPAPQVTRADVQTIQRLVNEFRAELAALGVRVTAVEEELSALKQAADKTKISGEANYRYGFGPSVGNGGGSFGAVASWGQGLLTFSAAAGSDASSTIRLALGGPVGSGVFQPGFPTTTGTIESVGFDRGYLDFNYFGLGWRVGRQTYTLGAIGLLFTEGSVDYCGCGVDGAVVSGSFGPVSFEVASFLHVANATLVVADTTPTMVRAAFDLAGWAIGANYYQESTLSGSANNTGYSVDLSGSLFGFGLTGEWATFDPSGAAAAVTAYQATLNLNSLVSGMMGGAGLSVWYKNYPGTGVAGTWSPALPGASDMSGITYSAGNLNVWGARLSMTLSPQLRPYVGFESGTKTGSGASFQELEVGIRSRISANVDARVRYQQRNDGDTAGVETDRYRVELFYSW